MSRISIACLLFAAGLIACTADAPGSGTLRTLTSPSLAAPPPPALPAVSVVSEGAAEQSAKRAGLPSSLVVAVDPQAFETLPAIAPELLSETGRLAAVQSAVPVLLPAEGAALDSAFLATGADWYTARLDGDGFTVGVFGTRRAFDHPSLRAADGLVIDEETPLVTVSEGVPSISFRRSGAAYRLDLECDAGSDGAACADTDTLRALYDAIGVVGGAR